MILNGEREAPAMPLDRAMVWLCCAAAAVLRLSIAAGLALVGVIEHVVLSKNRRNETIQDSGQDIEALAAENEKFAACSTRPRIASWSSWC